MNTIRDEAIADLSVLRSAAMRDDGIVRREQLRALNRIASLLASDAIRQWESLPDTCWRYAVKMILSQGQASEVEDLAKDYAIKALEKTPEESSPASPNNYEHAIRSREQAEQPAQCPHIVTNGTTSYCSLAESAGAPPAQVPEGWRVLEFSGSFKQNDEQWEVYDPHGSGGAVRESDVRDQMVCMLLDALAAAPTPPSAEQ